jgi:coenzyme F420-0:L-glutamate ligase
MVLGVYPITAQRQEGKFDLFKELTDAIEQNGEMVQNEDIIIISSKYVSNSQGRLVNLQNVITKSEKVKEMVQKYKIAPKIAEIILRESDKIFGGIAGFVITSSDDIMAPNAGIDKSNTKSTNIILYPNYPYLIAEQILRKIFLKYGVNVGVIIIDSRLMPARIGTIGIAISCAGIEPVHDMRGQKDLDGNPLKVTFQAVADNLASIANYKMGEGSESKPFTIIRDSGVKLTKRKIRTDEMSIPYDQCVYVRGLRNE